MSAPLLPILAAKCQLEALGFKCLPCLPKAKSCNVKDWPQKTFADQDFAADSNIAVKLQGFIDVDLDCAEAHALAPYILPASACVWGRKSRPRSHWLYAGELPETASFQFDGMIVEIRTGHHQTLAPGSTHPSGELVEFSQNGAPTAVNAVDLAFRARVLAAAVLVAREAWGNGNHHIPALAFSGILARACVPIEMATSAIRALAKFDSSTESLSDLLNAVETTYQRHAEGKAISGIKVLRDAGLSEAATTMIHKWLPGASPKDSLFGYSHPPNWKNLMTTVEEFIKRPFPPREALIEDVLLKCDAAILYGEPGEGKTLLSLSMANALARGDTFGPFKVSSKRKVAFIEGEMSGPDLVGQFKKMQISGDVRLIPSADLQASTPDISHPAQQTVIIEALEKEQIEVVWFDNLFSLAQITEFISNDDPGINQLARFAAELRNRGITAIFVHHATKTGTGPMGATRLVAPMDLVMKVTRNDDVISLSFEKHRSRAKPPTKKLKITEIDGLLFLQEAALAAGVTSKAFEEGVLLELATGNTSYDALKTKLDCTKSTISNVMKSLAAKGDVAKTANHSQASYALTEQGKNRASKLKQ